uniref:Lipocalin/cytosolic fatty-acid binding domain-containing protein n=1 Tax=Timema poppense TaxID=170557 RepID=A0A7R9H791_TIMPO|nr:unnamed protein product [Timema poppensis]
MYSHSSHRWSRRPSHQAHSWSGLSFTRRVEFGGNVLKYVRMVEWEDIEGGDGNALIAPDRDSNPDILIISSPVYCYSDAFDHAATETGSAPISAPYWVLGTDYTSYSVVWSCVDAVFLNLRFSWLLTREKNPSPEVFQSIEGVLAANNLKDLPYTDTAQTC